MQLNAGTIIDERYEILSRLGAGAIAFVYKVRQLQLERIVALKFLNVSTDEVAAEMERAQREAMTLSALKHPCLVTCYGFGHFQNQPYIVIEYLEGKSLEEELCEKGALDPKRTTAIFKQLCKALSIAHAQGIIHRDLKPSNVILVNQGGFEIVKVIDFGLARLLPGFGKDLQKLTKAGMVVGTGLYMSPEQCLGNALDQRSDIYSLGVMLYQCLSGSVPFLSNTALETMNAHVSSPPPALGAVHKTSGFQSLINRALAKDPQDRYASMEEMLADLHEIEAGRGQNLSCEYKSTKCNTINLLPGIRVPLTVAIALCSLLAISGVLVYTMLSAQRRVSTETTGRAVDLILAQADKATKDKRYSAARELYYKALSLSNNNKKHPLDGKTKYQAGFHLWLTDIYLGRNEEARLLAVELLQDSEFRRSSTVDQHDVYVGISSLFKLKPKDDSEVERANRAQLLRVLRSEVDYNFKRKLPLEEMKRLLETYCDVAVGRDELMQLTNDLKKNYARDPAAPAFYVSIATKLFRNPQ
jgi:serine/threonine protein kinase